MSVEMRDSGIDWIGEIPKHWDLNLLSSLFYEHSLKNTGMQENNLLSLSYGKIIRKNIDENGGLLPASFEGYNIISPNDIVFRLTDLQNDKRSLRTGICTEKGIITSAYITIRKRNNNLSSRYFHYLLHSYDECKVFYGIGNGVRQGMNYQDLRKLLLVNPPTKEEQSRIANFLDKKCAEIDELIALQEQMIAQLNTYKQAVITETVTKGLDPNVKMKDSGVEWIGEIPEHWEVKPFKAIYNLGKGLSITKADLVESGTPVISYGQIHSKQNVGTCIKDSLIRFVPEKYLKENKQSLVNRGDVIFADTSEDREGCGNCVYVDKDISLFAGYHTIIARNVLTYKNNYFSYLFQTDCWRLQIRSLVNGVKLFSIPQKLLSTTSLIVPTQKEQQNIANYLDQKCKEIDELISVKKEKIEKLKAYKKSVIYEYVTGKKQVTI